jgi:hypothetical protein
VLLRGLTITPTRARYDDFDLTLDDEVEVNPVLLHKLASVFGAVIEKPSQERIAAQLAKAAARAEIPGFSIEKRKVIGTFTYAKLPMVRDLEAAGDLLADSELVAAIAGDGSARGWPSRRRSPPTWPISSATSCVSSPGSAASRCARAAPPGSAPRSALAPRRMRPLSSP